MEDFSLELCIDVCLGDRCYSAVYIGKDTLSRTNNVSHRNLQEYSMQCWGRVRVQCG